MVTYEELRGDFRWEIPARHDIPARPLRSPPGKVGRTRMGLIDSDATEVALRPAIDLRSDVRSPPTPAMFEALTAIRIIGSTLAEGTMPALEGRIWDQVSGWPLEARVHVLASSGEFRAPDGVLPKVGPREPYFYCEERFSVEVPRGPADIVVERGTEYRPLRLSVDVPAQGTVAVDLPLERWTNLPEQGWYSGNTHVHYDETETRALERLRLDPRVEDLPVFVASVFKRGDLPHASNVFPIGRHRLSTPDHIIDIGEESRHNDEPWHIGLGHIMLINLQELVEPVSRGLLVDDSSPDYPPLIEACDVTHAQGGVALWCHNATGMEAPVAAILGRLDGVNLFVAFWMGPEYEICTACSTAASRSRSRPAPTGSSPPAITSTSMSGPTSPTAAGWMACARAAPSSPTARCCGSPSPATVPATRSWRPGGPACRSLSNGQAPSRSTASRSSAMVKSSRSPTISLGRRRACSRPISPSKDRVGWPRAAGAGVARVTATRSGPIPAPCISTRVRRRPARRRPVPACFLDGIDAAQTWLRTKACFDDTGQRDRMLELFDEGRARSTRLGQASAATGPFCTAVSRARTPARRADRSGAAVAPRVVSLSCRARRVDICDHVSQHQYQFALTVAKLTQSRLVSYSLALGMTRTKHLTLQFTRTAERIRA